MHTVVETASYLADAKAAGVDGHELASIAATVASDPSAGD
jgi:hypothetical protein